MTPAARIAAAIGVLDQCFAGSPAEKALIGWARGSRFAGSGDRAAVRDLVFSALRRRRSAAAAGGAETGRGVMIGLLRQQGLDPESLFTGAGHAPEPLQIGEAVAASAVADPVRLDLPDWLWPRFQAALGHGAEAAALALRDRASVFLRVNPGKGDAAAAIGSLAAEGIVAVPHPQVKTALQVTEGERKISRSAAYLDGLVELQDAASQAAVLRLPLQPGMSVLDLCAGGGGKALAMAALADMSVTAHDIDAGRMRDIPARAARAGTPIRVAAPGQQRFDLVLIDAPCSGSGTWRRAPDAKWRLTPEALVALTEVQDRLLDQAAARVAPGGTLAYATCSVLGEENGDRVAAFRGRAPGWRLVDEMRLTPGDLGDGFYMAMLRQA